MDWSVPLLVVGSFVGTTFVFSRVFSWVAGLVTTFGKHGVAKSEPISPFSLVQVFLHSGPWLLALPIGAIYYVATLPQPVWLWAVLGGFGLAVAVVLTAVALAYLRQRRKQVDPAPLTPERLAKIRRRFFLGTSVYFGGTFSVFILYQLWSSVSATFVVFVLGVCIGGGYVFAWFMWQWYGALLEAREQARQRQGQGNAV